jgi:hypothetical protein
MSVDHAALRFRVSGVKQMSREAYYDVGLVCLNGHEVNANYRDSPERNAKFCPNCGAKTINACPSCNESIRGWYFVPGVLSVRSWEVSGHCHECGTSYPWTERKAKALAETIDELDELDSAEREKLKDSIPDVMSDTPSTDVATSRFRKAMTKMGTTGRKLLYDVLTKVASEAVVKSLGM